MTNATSPAGASASTTLMVAPVPKPRPRPSVGNARYVNEQYERLACCIFRPAFGCYALQTHIEIYFFTFIACFCKILMPKIFYELFVSSEQNFLL